MASILFDETGGATTLIGWGLVAVALAAEALASMVYLRRHATDARDLADDAGISPHGESADHR